MKKTTQELRERLCSSIRELEEMPERYAREPDRNFTRRRALTPAVGCGWLIVEVCCVSL